MLIVEGHKILNYSEHMSDEEFYVFCQANPNLRIERDQDQNIIILAPVGGESGYYEKNFIFEVEYWVRKNKEGRAFSSSTGFILPNKAVRSPDASWVSNSRWEKVPDHKKKKFLEVVPDFIVEVRSHTDGLDPLKYKLQEWIENGVQLAWLIDPEQRHCHIYRADGSIEIIKDFEQTLSGEDIMPGFSFDLRQLRLP